MVSPAVRRARIGHGHAENLSGPLVVGLVHTEPNQIALRWIAKKSLVAMAEAAADADRFQSPGALHSFFIIVERPELLEAHIACSGLIFDRRFD